MSGPLTRPLLLTGAAWWVATAAGAQVLAPVGSPMDTLPRPELPAQPGADARVDVDVQRPALPGAEVLNARLTPRKFDIEGVQSMPFEAVARCSLRWWASRSR